MNRRRILGLFGSAAAVAVAVVALPPLALAEPKRCPSCGAVVGGAARCGYCGRWQAKITTELPPLSRTPEARMSRHPDDAFRLDSYVRHAGASPVRVTNAA